MKAEIEKWNETEDKRVNDYLDGQKRDKGRVLPMNEVIGWEWWRRGDICVIRSVHGQHEVLRIHNKRDYKEWLGCFSII